jgi:hypothetical protein
MAACRAFLMVPQEGPIRDVHGYAAICSDLGTSAQKCPKSEVAV